MCMCMHHRETKTNTSGAVLKAKSSSTLSAALTPFCISIRGDGPLGAPRTRGRGPGMIYLRILQVRRIGCGIVLRSATTTTDADGGGQTRDQATEHKEFVAHRPGVHRLRWVPQGNRNLFHATDNAPVEVVVVDVWKHTVVSDTPAEDLVQTPAGCLSLGIDGDVIWVPHHDQHHPVEPLSQLPVLEQAAREDVDGAILVVPVWWPGEGADVQAVQDRHSQDVF
mmetsp:Transcript_87186/g.272984  ORF Transcript_87186/g.272984 Transcript_87186/m.272984 type:complete len:224 (-) Transcript_87186:528-1199(-)